MPNNDKKHNALGAAAAAAAAKAVVQLAAFKVWVLACAVSLVLVGSIDGQSFAWIVAALVAGRAAEYWRVPGSVYGLPPQGGPGD